MKSLRLALAAGIALAVVLGGTAWAGGKEQEAEIQGYIQTMNKAIQEKNDPMRNRMFIKFRLIEQDDHGVVAPLLIENLKSQIAGVPEYTAFTLGWIRDPRALQPLREMLKGSDDFKRAAAKALGNMEAKEAIPDLIQLLADPSGRVRQDAAYSLGLIGDDSANEALRKASEDSDDLVQFFAREALERIENRKKYGW
jgi:hypothetical protein